MISRAIRPATAATDLEQVRRDPARSLPESPGRLAAVIRAGASLKGSKPMKRLTQWSAAAGLMAAATAAHAQTVMPVSDFGGPGPYAAIRTEAPLPGYG